MTKSVLILPRDLYRTADQAKQLQEELKEKEATIAQQAAELELVKKQLAELQANSK